MIYWLLRLTRLLNGVSAEMLDLVDGEAESGGDLVEGQIPLGVRCRLRGAKS